MIDPLKLNKSDINKEVLKLSREGILLSKDSLLYHAWRIFWVTEDVIHRIKVIRVRESGSPESLYTKGSLHPISSELIERVHLEKVIYELNRDLFDFVLVIQDGTLINQFMDFWLYANYQIYKLQDSDAEFADGFAGDTSPLFIKNLNVKNSKRISLIPEFQTNLVRPGHQIHISTFIQKYYDYSLQRVYLLNNDELSIAPYNFHPEELYCVSAGIKPACYFSQMKTSLKKIHFCDYSPLALSFWQDLIKVQSKADMNKVFEKFSQHFIGSSSAAQEASRIVRDHQLKTSFNDEDAFFELLSQMKKIAHFLKVDIISGLDFLKDARGPYYFWFSNSYERNLTLLQETREDHKKAHLGRLHRMKKIHSEKIYYNDINYDFRIKDVHIPYAMGTQDIVDPSPIEWREL